MILKVFEVIYVIKLPSPALITYWLPTHNFLSLPLFVCYAEFTVAEKKVVKASGKPGLIILHHHAVIGDIEPHSLFLCLRP
jgi:hypothetical protein